MHSQRLSYRALQEDDVDALHGLVCEAHVRRYLFDDLSMERAWCEEAIATSRRAFEARGLGLWLVFPLQDGSGAEPIGFCGFWVFEELGPEPQLLYALTAPHTGQGLATEAGHTMVDAALAAGQRKLSAAVDAPNRASMRVLEKLGFRRSGEAPGAFGRTVLFERR